MTAPARWADGCPAPPASPWLPCPPPAGASLLLFCVPHAGAGASSFRDWPGHLPPHVAVCPVQPPGREARFREAPYTHIAPLVTSMLEGLAPHLNRPFALYGHSVGALVVFEFARAVRAAGLPPPVHLFVSGRPAPQSPATRPQLHELGHPELMHALYDLGGTPAAVLRNPGVRDLLLPLIRADFAVNETYRYRWAAPLDLPLTVYQGIDDSRVSIDEAREWEQQSTGPFRVKHIRGDHFFITTSRLALTRDISEQLGG